LTEVLDIHGLRPVHVSGAGYYPLPSAVGKIDPRHSHFITVKAVKQRERLEKVDAPPTVAATR
jgi:hypothetical protein